MKSISTDKWLEKEKSPPPHYLRNVRKIDYKQLRDAVLSQDEAFAADLVESYYAGDAVLVKQAFDPELLVALRKKVYEWGKLIAPVSVAKARMVTGIQNCHYLVDTTGQKDGYETANHSYYFFRWCEDELGVFEAINPVWTTLKIMGGLQADAYANTRPADGVIDRVQVMHYPPGRGHISPHSDPFKNQRHVLGTIMTVPGADYQQGGFHMITSDKKKVNVESQVELGDIITFYASCFHCCETVDPGKSPDWNSDRGRWFMAMQSVDSHEKKNRGTALRVDC